MPIRTAPPGGVGTDSNPYRGFGGNPFLDPFTSWNFDVAAEYYFTPAGFVSLTGFHRAVDGFIQPNTFRVNDATLGVVAPEGHVLPLSEYMGDNGPALQSLLARRRSRLGQHCAVAIAAILRHPRGPQSAPPRRSVPAIGAGPPSG